MQHSQQGDALKHDNLTLFNHVHYNSRKSLKIRTHNLDDAGLLSRQKWKGIKILSS